MERLINIFARVLEVPPSAIDDHTSPENMDVWDSLKFMQLIVEFEEEFDLTLDIEKISKLKSFADFKSILSEFNAIE